MLINDKLRILLLLAWVMSANMIHAQYTFSQTYHLKVGNDNRAQFFFLEDTSFVVATTHDGEMEVVAALTRFNYRADVVDQNAYSDYVFGPSTSIVKTGNGFEVAGHR